MGNNKQTKIRPLHTINPTPEQAPPPPAPAVPAQDKPMAVVIIPQESYQGMRNWAYTNLKASEFDALIGFFRDAKEGTFQVSPPKQ